MLESRGAAIGFTYLNIAFRLIMYQTLEASLGLIDQELEVL
jgi:hypothetical protein